MCPNSSAAGDTEELLSDALAQEHYGTKAAHAVLWVVQILMLSYSNSFNVTLDSFIHLLHHIIYSTFKGFFKKKLEYSTEINAAIVAPCNHSYLFS